MTELEKLAEKYRTEHIARNAYNGTDLYGTTNKNALSDGDEKGKGENNGSVGSKTDILIRNESLASNRFKENNRYFLALI